MLRAVRRLVACAGLAAALAACGEEAAGTGAQGGGAEVVAATTQLADLARNVAGDRAEVRGLLDANTDPHDYEIRPSDLDDVAGADVVLRSGGDLDAWLAEGIESAGGSPEVVDLIDSVPAIEGEAGHHEGEAAHAGEEAGHAGEGLDPHWWQDPRNAMRAVSRIRDGLVAADPAGADAYRANAVRYAARLKALDAAVAACIDAVPAARRKLVTTHDSLGYYARRYGIEVIGAVIPSLSTRGQPSAGETAALVRTIRTEKVKAIFAESSVDPKVERAISRESGARIGTPLYADTLGPAGSDGDSYLKSIAANTAALVDGFTDGAQTCDLPA